MILYVPEQMFAESTFTFCPLWINNAQLLIWTQEIIAFAAPNCVIVPSPDVGVILGVPIFK